MKTRKLGNTGIVVSELCLGAMNFGNPRFGVDEAESRRVIDAYLDLGGNFIDTADAYTGGVSEEIVGRVVGSKRERVVIATKAFYPVTPGFSDPPAHPNAQGSSRRHLTQALDASLKRLGTDYVDLYQVHCWDDLTPLEETLSALDSFVQQGKVRYAGLSNFTAWQIVETAHVAKAANWAPMVTAQMQYSLVARDIELDVVPACQRHGIGILSWSPLGGGVLTGKYQDGAAPEGSRHGAPTTNARALAWRARFLNDRNETIVRAVADVAKRRESTSTAVSLAWLLAKPIVSSVIIGPKTAGQLEQNLAGAGLRLSVEDMATLDDSGAPTPRYPEWFVAGAQRAN